ncbi:piRNA biogenesis protein EXD1 isoform X6 [Athene noctua]|uniref:piRNA biogenesis protein EXD1 isoform X6 n=1 Tax=Athene noctua TaxID=126797 RepID=UPI003EB82ED8
MALGSGRFGPLLEKTLKITLKCGVFQGVLHHVNPDRSVLLRAVKNLETGRSTPGVKLFFDHEIVNVELLDEPDSGRGTSMLSECTSAIEGNKQADTGPEECGPCSSPCISLESQLRSSDTLKYSLSEEKDEEDVEYTVVDSFQQKFDPAVLHLREQHVVSIAGEGVNLCRHGKLSWLEIATEHHIFLFDIFLLGPQAFKNGLQMVLQDKNIVKVMHDCRWISDCLFHQYGVLLTNVFDTQPTCMELPQELRQLADIQKLRREKAIKDYRMNEDGLLIRPAVELKGRNDPQKDENYRDNRDCLPTNKAVSQMTAFYDRDVVHQEKSENQNQVLNLWKNLIPTSSWL